MVLCHETERTVRDRSDWPRIMPDLVGPTRLVKDSGTKEVRARAEVKKEHEKKVLGNSWQKSRKQPLQAGAQAMKEPCGHTGTEMACRYPKKLSFRQNPGPRQSQGNMASRWLWYGRSRSRSSTESGKHSTDVWQAPPCGGQIRFVRYIVTFSN